MTDSLGIEKALELFPEQIKECWDQAISSNIEKVECSSVVISGMGGSSNAGKIIQGLFESELKIPLVVFNDYGLPGWVNSDTLIVANSYSGNTEETLSGVESAKKVGTKIIGIATGGKIGEMIKSGEMVGAVITPGETNPSGFPKSGLGVSLGGLAGALSKAGVISLTGEELDAALIELKQIKSSWNAKEVAEWLNGYLPVLMGARPLIGSLNAGRNALCEISRNFTQFYDFPEVDHVLVEATTLPAEAKEKIKYLFFKSKFNNDRVTLRYEVTKQIFDKQGLSGVMDYELKGSTKLVQSLELPYFCAWIGFYLSTIQGNDPGPEPWIIELKEKLSQPVH